MQQVDLKSKPRTGKYGDEIGAYHLASRVFSKTVNPGDMFKFEQYITGYGDINSSKIRCYISSEIFDIESSSIINSIKDDNGNISFGNQSDKITGEGFVCHISGIQLDGWEQSTMAFDVSGDENSKTIFCENKVENAPFTYNLKLKDDVKPGEYSIDFYFTYYDGHRWQCNKETVDLKVRNFFETNAKIISTLAIVATSISIFRFGVLPVINWFLGLVN